jgi:surfactin synthase thioesterase subunit
MAGTGAPWFVELVADGGRPRRVLGLPHAGAGCTAFAGCAGALGGDIALWGLNLPGRQARFHEPPITDLDELVGTVTAALRGCADRPYVLFGYCSGALLAYLVAVEARRTGLPAPKALVVASYPAPDRAEPPRALHRLPAGAFWREIESYGGFSAQLLADPDHREVFEPALRADYQALSTFHYVPVPPLEVPIVALAGRRDPVLAGASLAAWSAHTSAGARWRLLDGDHWLLDTAGPAVARVLARECRR